MYIELRDYHYRYKRTVEPTIEPVTITDMQDHIYGYDSADESYITGLITVARQMFEEFTSLAILEQTWQLSIPGFPLRIKIRKSPIRSISGITYYDSSGTQQTLSASYYRSSMHEFTSIVDEAYGKSWPATEQWRDDAVTVTFVAGIYTDDGGSPLAVDTGTGSYLVRKYAMAQQAIKLMVAHLFENRSAVVPIQLSECPLAFRAMVEACRAR